MKPFLFAFFSLSLCVLQAQSPVENLQKYNTFRQRMRTEFMFDMDDASRQATCLPMECRRVSSDGRVTAYWADATWWLGHYVAVLATEYRRLQLEDNPDAAASTLAELKRALAVYDRLDCMAELCWGADTSTNGFYLRDDVPATYRDTFGVDDILSDYARKCGELESVANGPSQDQAWASYLGLALVRALTDDEAARKHASVIAGRLIRAMQYTDAKGKESWQVVNPVTGAVLQSSSDIQWLKYAHARAGEVLTGNACNFDRALSSASRQCWQLIQQGFTLDRNGYYNWYGVLSLSAVINEKTSAMGTTCDWLMEQCRTLSELHPDLQQPLMFPHLPLINRLLYPSSGNLPVPDTLYEHILDAAPTGGGHHYAWMGDSGRVAAPWHTLSLFCPWHEGKNSEFNMMDYLLLYNLYRLVYAPEIPQKVPAVVRTSVKIRPNPTEGKLYLHFPEDGRTNDLSLYSADGRRLRTLKAFSEEMEMDVSDLPAGFYFLRYAAEGRPLQVGKFVKK